MKQLDDIIQNFQIKTKPFRKKFDTNTDEVDSIMARAVHSIEEAYNANSQDNKENINNYTYFVFCTHATDPLFKNESIVNTQSPIDSNEDIISLKKVLLSNGIFFQYGTGVEVKDIIVNSISLLNIVPTKG